MARRCTRRGRTSRLALIAVLALAAAGAPAASALNAASSSSSTLQSRPTLNPTDTISKALSKTHTSWAISAKDKIVGSVANFLYHAIPDPSYFSYDLDQFDDLPDIDALPAESGLGDGTSGGLNWGGSTLEVVRSQAIFLTRSAAFGPRVINDEGLRGFLLPISDFYTAPDAAVAATSPNQVCPVENGPGWRSSEALSRYNEEDQRLYSGLLRYPSKSEPTTWTHLYNETMPKPPHNWIALMERGGGCGFAAKVRVAQDLGAIAVVVGDASDPSWHGGKTGDPNEEGDPGLSGKRLITMFAPGDTSDVSIPSTFVTRPSYLALQRQIEETEKDEEDWQKEHTDQKKSTGPRGLEIVIGKDDTVWEWPLIDLGILLLLLPSFMTIFTIIVHRVRMIRQRRKERAPQLMVLSLPCLIWRSNGQPWEKIEGSDADSGPANGVSSANVAAEGQSSNICSDDLEAGMSGENIPLLQEDENGAGSSKAAATLSSATRVSTSLPPGRTYFSTDECAICLSDFVDGDRVRILPCGHIFHQQEIDDWLVRVKKLCPICKRDITVPIPPTPPVAAHAELPAAPSSATIATSNSIDLIQHLSDDTEDTPLLSGGRQV